MWITQPPQENISDAFDAYLADVLAKPNQYPEYHTIIRAAQNLGPVVQREIRANLESQMRRDFLEATRWNDARHETETPEAPPAPEPTPVEPAAVTPQPAAEPATPEPAPSTPEEDPPAAG